MGDAILNRVFVAIFIEKLSLEQTPEGGELASHVTIWEWSTQIERIARPKALEQNPAWHTLIQGIAKKPYDWRGVNEWGKNRNNI